MSDVLAAFLYGQLIEWTAVQSRRKEVWDSYHANLAAWADAQGVSTPFVPAHCEQAYHMYYLLAPDLEYRTALIDHLKQRGILSVFHYLPLHLSTVAVDRFGGRLGQCPVTESVSDRLVRLPFHNTLSDEQQAEVVEAICEFR
jgi:dTDP-4-amino-4,6-dideoxygalactose transaminase